MPSLTQDLKLGTRKMHGLLQIAGWDNFEERVTPILCDLGFEGLGNYKTAQTAPRGRCWRIAPQKVLIEGVNQETVITDTDLVTLDLSQSRQVITVKGTDAQALLSQLSAVDFREDSFPTGNFVQTGIHGVGVLVHHRANTAYEIFVPSSWSQSIMELIERNAFGHCAQ